MEIEALVLIVVSSLASFAALGSVISYLKHRKPAEGLVLGALLGPIGVIVELRKPFGRRPLVDRGAWDSFRTVVDYQSDSRSDTTQLQLQLTYQPARPGRPVQRALPGRI